MTINDLEINHHGFFVCLLIKVPKESLFSRIYFLICFSIDSLTSQETFESFLSNLLFKTLKTFETIRKCSYLYSANFMFSYFNVYVFFLFFFFISPHCSISVIFSFFFILVDLFFSSFCHVLATIIDLISHYILNLDWILFLF